MVDSLRPFEAEGDGLVCVVTSKELGAPLRRVWSPTPSAAHDLDARALPRMVVLDLAAASPDNGAKFSPPPFAVTVEADGQAWLLAARADAGWHRWNEVAFAVDADGARVSIDLQGRTSPGEAASHVSLHVIAQAKGETRWQLLARGMRQLYPGCESNAANVPAWWRKPIYCGWGDQVTIAQWLEGVGPEYRAPAYCIQGLYERWIKRLEEAEVPVGTVIVDDGWSTAGSWRPVRERWRDMRAFIDRQHQAGRRVLLWLGLWLWDDLPDEWCILCNGEKLTADPTHPDYQSFVAERVHDMLSPEGLNADGFKIDQLGYVPHQRRPKGGRRTGWTKNFDPPTHQLKLAGNDWGCELLYRYQKLVHQAAHRARADALITSSTVHPIFHDSLDMVRLHDMGDIAPDVMKMMTARAELSKAILPGKVIDADNWIHRDYSQWFSYTRDSKAIGVPSTLYAERFMLDWEKEPATKLIPMEDLRAIGASWRDVR